MTSIYHDGSRALQDAFDTRRLADRLEERHIHAAFREGERDLIEAADMFFLATADMQGRPTCSYKGGEPGFVRVVSEDTLAFPSYDGNGMFLSLGNAAANPHVGLLFIDFAGQRRLRVQGEANVRLDDPLLADYPEAQCIVRVRAREIFANCPRYLHRYQLVERSVYTPHEDRETPVPDWKRSPAFADALPATDPARRSQAGPA
jgi:predicted pyridoxine 5'-phosphate oxidase superfamily flavin-nucleotide-binding protein